MKINWSLIHIHIVIILEKGILIITKLSLIFLFNTEENAFFFRKNVGNNSKKKVNRDSIFRIVC